MSNLQLQFAPADDPRYLSKVGHWVITFLSKPQADITELAITNVIPRQANLALQARKFIIESSGDNTLWDVVSIACFDGQKNCNFELDVNHSLSQQFLLDLLEEFARYDVEIEILKKLNI